MFNIPDEHLPNFAKDEQRLNVLFAPLRNRSVNPKDWDNKINSWKTLISLYCMHNDAYSFTLSSLNNIFVRNGRPPSCLTVVIEDMLRNNEIKPARECFKKSESWGSWASYTLVKRPITWSYTKIKNSIFDTSQPEENYAHLEVIRSKSHNLFTSIPANLRNKLVSIAKLQELTPSSIDINNLKLLLNQLESQSKAATTELDLNHNGHAKTVLIKIGEGSKVKPISDVDIGIYTLENNESMLLKKMEELEDSVQNCVGEAKAHLKKGHKQMAKNSLRKRNEIEKRLEKNANALYNVQMLLEKLRDSHSDITVWESYKQALSAFNTTFTETGLSEDAVEDTMIKLGEVLELHQDIQGALARPAMDEGLDSDLEEELADLLKNDDNDKNGSVEELEKELEKLHLLPGVPNISPNKSAVEELPTNF